MNKAQVKMSENIAIIFIFIMLVVFGFIFYARIHKVTVKYESEEQYQLKAVEIALKTSKLPETSCPSDKSIENCFDLLKVQIAKKSFEDPYYYDVLEYSLIVVKEIYPDTNQWTLYNNTGNRTRIIPSQIPVSLYDALTQTYHFGIVEVGVYAQ